MNMGHKSLGFAAQVYEPLEAARETANTDLDALRAELRSEVRALRAMVRGPKAASKPPGSDLSAELAAIRAAIDELSAASTTSTKKDKVQQWLKAAGVEGGAAARIIALCKNAEGEPEAKIKFALEKMVTFEPWSEEHSASKQPRIVAVVGPSGVGKTTTVAKMAAAARIAGKSVALVSCDGFRVGAIDQLERYSELLDAGFYVAANAIELKAVLAEVTEDIVFVDTSGRPPTPDSPESAMPEIENAETFLCVAASTRAADAARIVQTFAKLEPTRAIITKVDETETPAALVHLPFAMKKPLATICTGPRVPEDIEPAGLDGLLAHFAKSIKTEEKNR